jgi:hypothetical protein
MKSLKNKKNQFYGIIADAFRVLNAERTNQLFKTFNQRENLSQHDINYLIAFAAKQQNIK